MMTITIVVDFEQCLQTNFIVTPTFFPAIPREEATAGRARKGARSSNPVVPVMNINYIGISSLGSLIRARSTELRLELSPTKRSGSNPMKCVPRLNFHYKSGQTVKAALASTSAPQICPNYFSSSLRSINIICPRPLVGRSSVAMACYEKQPAVSNQTAHLTDSLTQHGLLSARLTDNNNDAHIWGRKWLMA